MTTFPSLCADSETLQFVPSFRYLGHVITSNNTGTDDADILREVTNIFVHTNILIRKYSKCSVDVKTVLFKAYCI